MPPHDVRTLAHARRDARAARDWAEADRLKAAIEAAGWRVVDRGVDFMLVPASPPDLEVDGATWYGSPASVPSVMDLPADQAATVLAIGGPASTDIAKRTSADGVQLIGVTWQADPEPPSGVGLELVRLGGAPSFASAVVAGLRRSAGRVVIVVGPGPVEASLDAGFVDGLSQALAEESVASAGIVGAVTADLREFEPVVAGDADVLLPGAVAFRRDDAIARLPFEERFDSPARFVEWLTLRLRSAPDDEGPIRRAVVVPGLDAAVAADAAARAADAASEDRASKRDFYRLFDAFGRRPDLLSRLR